MLQLIAQSCGLDSFVRSSITRRSQYSCSIRAISLQEFTYHVSDPYACAVASDPSLHPIEGLSS